MRTLIDLRSERNPICIVDTPTAVDCGRELRFRRSFRSIVERIAPCCGLFPPSDSLSTNSESTHSSSTVTGTFFGRRRGRVRFCLQHDARSSPLLLLEFAVPTSHFAHEMRSGLLRVALECDKRISNRFGPRSLFDVPVWSMYCNGRKVGFAVRREMTAGDAAVLGLMRSVSAGAGVLSVATRAEQGDELIYLRASFERVVGSVDSESFHVINPGGSPEQELSIFLLRS